MPRKGPAVRREVAPDPVYQNPLVTQLINKVLLDGKKTVAERTVYEALEQISQKTANDPVITLKKAVENVRPMLEVKSRRVGGASYQVPVEVRPSRGTTLALRWLVNYSRARRENSMAERSDPGDHGRRQRHGHLGEATRGHAQDGRGEQGVRALPVVMDDDGSHRPGLRGPGSPPRRRGRR